MCPRSIPTCVGTTICPVVSWRDIVVHPHVRGDYGFSKPIVTLMYGPSPRAWGLRRADAAAQGGRRSIPTCVGTTRPSGARGARGAVHPHVRGDYSSRTPSPCLDLGPSPRAWGLRGHPLHGVQVGRSIPTCVGTTGPLGGLERGGPVHPHVRGDYLDQDGKNTASPSVMCLLGNDYELWFSRSPSEALARRFLYLSTCLDSFSAFRAASAFRTPTNTIPSKSRRKRSG
jgi:hypothetical protein